MMMYEPASPKHLKLHQSLSKVRAFFGGNRAGKTRWGAQEVIWHMFKVHPFHEPWPDPLRVRICVTNEKQGMIQVMLPLFKELLPPESWRWRADPKIMEVATGDGQTAEIEFLTYEQDVDKFGGVSRHIVWMDEEPRLRDQYYQNLMRTVDVRGKMIMSMTPLFGVTWAYDEIVEGDPEIVDHEYVTIYDNKFLPLDEIELIERTADPDIKDAILYGRFISPTLIGLAGHSGAGKSTLINLICRFYDVQEGGITVDGYDVQDVGLK